MVNLIITLISISLIAIVSVSTMMYLGNTTSESRQDIVKSKLISTGNMITSSNELYYVNNNKLATSINELIDNNYLENYPNLPEGIQLVDEVWESGFIKFRTTAKSFDENKDFYMKLCNKVNKTAGYKESELKEDGTLFFENDNPSNYTTRQFSCYANYNPKNNKKDIRFGFK